MGRVDPWQVRAAGAYGSTVISTLLRTVQYETLMPPETRRLRENQQAVVYAFWHGSVLPLVFLHRDEGIVVLSSHHRDGEAMARVAGAFGYLAARGSTTRSGSSGLLTLVRHARKGRSLGLTPDGPKGPAGSVQPGTVVAARLSRLPIVPIGVGVSSAWRMKSWDSFIVPKPFSTVAVHYGVPLPVTGNDEDAARAVQQQLEILTQTAEEAALSQAATSR